MPPAFRRLLAVLLMPLAASCASLRGKAGPAPAATRAEPENQLVGLIEMVNPEQEFVLIRCEVVPVLPREAELTTLGADGSEASLVLTPERKGRHLTADIRSGRPQVNQFVFYRAGSAPETAPEPPPAAPPPARPPGLPGMPSLPSLPGLPPGFEPPPGP